MEELDGKYSERVQLPTKAIANHLVKGPIADCHHNGGAWLMEQPFPQCWRFHGDNNGRFMEFFDRYFHIPLPIVTKHELGLPFPPRNLPIQFDTNPSTIFLVIMVTDRHTDKPTPVKTYSLAFAGIKRSLSHRQGTDKHLLPDSYIQLQSPHLTSHRIR